MHKHRVDQFPDSVGADRLKRLSALCDGAAAFFVLSAPARACAKSLGEFTEAAPVNMLFRRQLKGLRCIHSLVMSINVDYCACLAFYEIEKLGEMHDVSNCKIVESLR